MRDTDGNPNGVDLHGTPTVTRSSKRLLVILGVFLCAALGLLVYSTGRQPSAPPPAPHPAAAADEKALLETPKTTGLAVPNVPVSPAPVPAPVEPRTARPTPALDPVVLEQWRQVRAYRAQQQLQGLQSPLEVSVSLPPRQQGHQQPQPSVSLASGGGREVLATADPSSGYNPADQKDKEAFLRERSADGRGVWTLPNARVPGAACEIKTGTVIPGIMLSGINSDLPGQLIAQVSQNVYDTATGQHVLIPQGSRLLGRYDSRIVMGQERVLIAWNRILFPDGSSVDMGSMPGADQAGYAGFTDKVNNHYFRVFGSAFLMSLITGGMAYSMDALRPDSGGDNQNPTVQDEMGSALAAQMGQASMQLLQRNSTIQPTLEVRPGYRFNLVVVKDVVFDAPYRAWR